MLSTQNCRFCDNELNETFIDLGVAPLSNSYLTKEDLKKQEPFYPLHVQICQQCFLVQLPQFATPENIFCDYAYFSSYSDSWLQHSQHYTEMMIKRFAIDSSWHVVEIASNDGYLLQYFKAQNIPVLGIEPALNVASVAESKGIPTIAEFFGKNMAETMRKAGKAANLIIANNVLAHVPDLNGFVAGLKILLAQEGILTIEFPHLLRLIEGNQFDTIYHEHFSYFSLLTAQQVFDKYDMAIFDVEEIAPHGGSLRIFVKHQSDVTKPINKRVDEMLAIEKAFGLNNMNAYKSFASKIAKLKACLLDFVSSVKAGGKKIVGYGAPAKGNTLLNYCGIGIDVIAFTVDKNPYKQGRFLPGMHLPILHPDEVLTAKPDYLFILPWNIKEEIMAQMAFIKDWGGKFIVPVPELQVI